MEAWPAATVECYLDALFAAPPLARALKSAWADPQPRVWPGLLLLAVLVLGPIGLRWKFLFLRRRNADSGCGPQGSIFGSSEAAPPSRAVSDIARVWD